MKPLAVILLGFSAAALGASPRWSESVSVFAAVEGSTDAKIIAEVDAALLPLGFHRDSTGTTYPGDLVPGIFASYALGNLAKGLVVEGARPGCIVFSLTNYDSAKEGLAAKFQKAVRARLTTSFRGSAKFYSDSRCANAL